jgi:hypothetical protein
MSALAQVSELRSPVELWERALRHLDAAGRCLQSAGALTGEAAVRNVSAREREQLQLLRERLVAERLTLQIEANKKTPAAVARPGAMTKS